ncbi:MAG: NTP transferase domain-containing protein [Candidatus Neomarinimicrobiota bacterium]
MSINNGNNDLIEYLQSLSGEIDPKQGSVAIILAAGHGKRIKSERSKMLHEIWGVPTVVRVANAASKGLASNNQIIVVGIKACEVAESAGKRANRIFVYQTEQKGTGHAVKEALSAISQNGHIKDIYIFPGDMGLITPAVVSELKRRFEQSGCGLALLTGNYKGEPEANSYGRIIRVPARTATGEPSGEDEGRVIEIKEHKDILAIPESGFYTTVYNGKKYQFKRSELLGITEYNTGVYAMKFDLAQRFIHQLTPDNVQGELYLTDIIGLFNANKIEVEAYPVDDESAVIGFNVKSVLQEMENIARRKVWKLLRDIIYIEDENDFFIADEVVIRILEMDKINPPLDIEIGKGVHISSGVHLERGVKIRAGSLLNGNIHLGVGTVVQENVSLSTYPNQQMTIGKNCVIMRGDLIKGNITIGDNTSIESSVIITGSSEYPTIIGKNVVIKGTTYIFGSIIEDDLFIEHSVLKCKRVERTVRKDGTIQPVRWVMPQPQGLDIVRDL